MPNFFKGLDLGFFFFGGGGGGGQWERAKHFILEKSSLLNFPTILTSFP